MISKLILVNAADLADTSAACYFTNTGGPIMITADYNKFQETLYLNMPVEGVAINDIVGLRFGNDKETAISCKVPAQI
jgi:hypothetical protein